VTTISAKTLEAIESIEDQIRTLVKAEKQNTWEYIFLSDALKAWVSVSNHFALKKVYEGKNASHN
jgi:hypothetical protein